jgi:hypothetical protein
MKTQNPDSKKPLWQEISGIDPSTERGMSEDQRIEALHKLVVKLDQIIAAEHARKVPAGMRTIFWDPIERACGVLGISRTQLSRYSYEATGLRAHERSDMVKAERLPGDLQAAVELFMSDYLEATVRAELDKSKPAMPKDIAVWTLRAARAFKLSRSGPMAAGFAAEMGYPNISRLKKGCMIAHKISLEEMELTIVRKLVQKFFDELKVEANSDENRRDAQSAEVKTATAARTSQSIKLPLAQPHYKEGEKRPEAV